MRLGIQPLVDVSDVNNFRYATEIQSVAGDATDLYFQLVDLDKKPYHTHTWFVNEFFGIRHLPSADLETLTLSVTFRNIDDAKQFVRFASQPFPEDSSIWKVSILTTDPVAGTVNLKFILTEDTVVYTTAVKAVFLLSEAQ
jgi:hypothetical protein